MVQHDVVHTIDRVVEIEPGRELIHEAQIDSPLAPLKINMISLWHLTDDGGRFAPIVRVLENKATPKISTRVELWSVPLKQQKYETTPQSPSYTRALETALSEAIAVNRCRTYIRFIADSVSVRTKVHIRVKIAVDRRRIHNSWQHVNHAVILREGGLSPGEFQIVPRV